MSKKQETIINIGQVGQYDVEKTIISGLSFIPTTKIVNGEEKRKSIPVRRQRVDLICTHDSGESVTFSAYLARGMMRFADSRKKGSQVTDTHVVAEITRMLQVECDRARQLLAS